MLLLCVSFAATAAAAAMCELDSVLPVYLASNLLTFAKRDEIRKEWVERGLFRR